MVPNKMTPPPARLQTCSLKSVIFYSFPNRGDWFAGSGELEPWRSGGGEESVRGLRGKHI